MSDRSGDLEGTDVGLSDLYRLHSRWLLARLRRRYGDEAEDLVQEAWLRAARYSRRGEIRNPKALLMTIVERLAIDARRRRAPRSLTVGDKAVGEVASAAPPQADAVLLKQIVMAMPPHLREVFVLSRFAHMEYQEISARLNISVTTVQWRMRKALEYCAAQLRL